MAGDWIKVEHATIDKPEVLHMADLLETTTDDVLGKLVRVWVWFDVQSRDGNAGSVTGVTLMKFIDRLVSSQGFASCMKKVGWLTDSGVPNFDLHNGESSKKRALTARRQRDFRNAKVTQNVTQLALPEKRREEKKHIRAHKTPLPESFGLSPRVIDWAKTHGFGRLQEHLDAFRLKAVAADYRYADWDAAFMEAIRADWARVNTKPAQRDEFRNVL